MSDHAQALMISTKVHAVFGYTLMAAGLARLIEICFLPAFPPLSILAPKTVTSAADDDNNSDNTLHEEQQASSYTARERTSRAFRHLPPFLLVAAGLLFMSATDEELQNIHDSEIDHVTYVLIMYSVAFVIYFFINFLIHLHKTTGRNSASSPRLHPESEEGIELRTPGRRWYAPVPLATNELGANPSGAINLNDGTHVIGEED